MKFNLQNIPIRTELGRKIRKAFFPATPSPLMSVDYKELETRMLAAMEKVSKPIKKE